MIDLAQYALAQTFRVRSAARNVYTTTCGACDARIPPDHGHEVLRTSLSGPRHYRHYFCPKCFAPLYAAIENLYPRFRIPLPDFWEELSRPVAVRPHVKRTPPQRPGPRELDALIAEREKQLHGPGDRDTPAGGSDILDPART